MCKWAATNLSASECEQFTRTGEAHIYQDLKIYICENATKTSSRPVHWTPCENYEGKDGRQDVDQGSTRNTSCPVCLALEEAQLAYEAAIAEAEAEKVRAENNAKVIIHYVSRRRG